MKQAPPTYRYSLCRTAFLCLTYGSYAVFCQLCLILLHVLQMDSSVSPDVLRHVFLPYLEYPLMSLAVILGGALLFEWLSRSKMP